MHHHSFDRLSRRFTSSSSRRALGGAVLGAFGAVLGPLGSEDATAHNALKACRKKKSKKQKAACLKRAKRHNARHKTTCGGKVCPRVPGGRLTCQSGACATLTCDAGFASCDGHIGTGCESNPRTDFRNCGKCGVVCPGSLPGSCVNGSCVRIFTTAGSPHDYLTPADGTITVEALGAGGGRGGRGDFGTSAGGQGGTGGGGARVVATFAVAAGNPLLIRVGAAGTDGTPGADNAGGFGGAGGPGTADGNDGWRGENGVDAGSGGGGGGGGDASDVYVRRSPFGDPDRIILAGGGSGGGGGAGGRMLFGTEGDGGNGGAGGGGLISFAPGGEAPGGDGGNGPLGEGQGPPGAQVQPGVHTGDGRVTVTFAAA